MHAALGFLRFKVNRHLDGNASVSKGFGANIPFVTAFRKLYISTPVYDATQLNGVNFDVSSLKGIAALKGSLRPFQMHVPLPCNPCAYKHQE